MFTLLVKLELFRKTFVLLSDSLRGEGKLQIYATTAPKLKEILISPP